MRQPSAFGHWRPTRWRVVALFGNSDELDLRWFLCMRTRAKVTQISYHDGDLHGCTFVYQSDCTLDGQRTKTGFLRRVECWWREVKWSYLRLCLNLGIIVPTSTAFVLAVIAKIVIVPSRIVGTYVRFGVALVWAWKSRSRLAYPPIVFPTLIPLIQIIPSSSLLYSFVIFVLLWGLWEKSVLVLSIEIKVE